MKPHISIIIATFNEEKHIESLLESICDQTFKKSFEIIIVDGNSTDKTKEKVKEFKRKNKIERIKIQLYDNPKRRTPYAFNIGIKESKADYFCIVGAHSQLKKDWVERSYKTIIHQPKDVMAVGGVWKSKSHNTKITESIVYATSNFWGGGISTYRYSKKASYVDTVVYGLYKKSVVKEIGFFDTNFLFGQDGEFNLRIKKKGFRMFFNPKIISYYKVRPTARKFIKQMYAYGESRTHILYKHKMLSIKPFFPLAFAAYICALPFLIIFLSWLLVVPLAIHTIITIVFSFLKPKNSLQNMFVYSIIHYCYGMGMLVALVKRIFGNKISG